MVDAYHPIIFLYKDLLKKELNSQTEIFIDSNVFLDISVENERHFSNYPILYSNSKNFLKDKTYVVKGIKGYDVIQKIKLKNIT